MARAQVHYGLHDPILVKIFSLVIVCLSVRQKSGVVQRRLSVLITLTTSYDSPAGTLVF